MKKLALLLVVALLFVASPVMAKEDYFYLGNQLLEECNHVINALDNENTNIDQIAAALCLGYVQGVHDLYAALKNGEFIVSQYCKPQNAPVSQMLRVIMKYLKDHPENLNYSASSLIIKALGEAFPCP